MVVRTVKNRRENGRTRQFVKEMQLEKRQRNRQVR